MRVLICPADRGGCGSYRMIWPAEALAGQGHDVRILPEGDTLTRGYYGADDELLDIDTPDADVIVLQRVLSEHLLALIPRLQAKGIAVVVEVDDDFTCIDPKNVAYANSQPETSPKSNYLNLLAACDLADLVTVSTPALARRFAPHGRVAVLENCVPERYLAEHGARFLSGRDWQIGQKVRVGWSGSTKTHPGDLNVTSGAVQRILRGTAQFSVVGTADGVQEALGLAKPPTKTGWVSLKKYPRAVAMLDVGIVPLKASAFNRAKSWLKGLEMAACGVPFVASATPEYERLANLGAGLLADRPKLWEKHLLRLTTDYGCRRDLAMRGREVAKAWTVERNAPRWLAAWHEAAAIRKAA